mgnify:CR=1 FL=1
MRGDPLWLALLYLAIDEALGEDVPLSVKVFIFYTLLQLLRCL